MKKLSLIVLCLTCITVTYAQKDTVHLKRLAQVEKNVVTDRAPQALYFQIGGSAPILSVNYDRRFAKKVNGFGFTAGLGFFGVSGASLFSIPVSINYLLGHNSNFVEFAAGTTFVTATTSDFFGNDTKSTGSGFIHHLNVGYRYQPTNGGFFFRGGISPLFAGGVGFAFTSYYLGFGHNF